MSLRPPTKADLDRLLLQIFQREFEGGEKRRASQPEDFDPNEGFIPDDPDFDGPGYDTESEAPPDFLLTTARMALKSNRYSFISDDVDEALKAASVTRPEPHERYLLLLREALTVFAAAVEYNYERDQGIYRPVVYPFPEGSSAAGPAPIIGSSVGPGWGFAPKVGLTISSAFEQFVNGAANWEPDTIRQARTTLRIFLDLIGDPDCGQLYPDDANRFKDELQRLPALFGKSIYRGLPASDAIRLCTKLKALKPAAGTLIEVDALKLDPVELPRLTATIVHKTINKHLDFMLGLYTWIRKIKKIPISNPFSDLLYKPETIRSRRKKEERNRLIWKTEHLQRLFSSPVWTGVHSPSRLTVPGSLIIEDERYWIPLLAIFTGMRLEEIAQLEFRDIQSIDDCWIIDIAPGLDKKVKSDNAIRQIPIHSQLLRIGFLDYCHAAKSASSSKLFPKLTRTGTGERYGAEFTKWFGRYRRAIGIPDAQRDFHSLRATFDTLLESKAGMNTTLVRSLMGHAIGGEGYWKGHVGRGWIEVIESLDYKIDLSHLYRAVPLPPGVSRQFDFTPNPWSQTARKRRAAAE